MKYKLNSLCSHDFNFNNFDQSQFVNNLKVPDTLSSESDFLHSGSGTFSQNEPFIYAPMVKRGDPDKVTFFGV